MTDRQEDVVLAGLMPAPGAGVDQHEQALDNLRYLQERLRLDQLPAEHRTLVSAAVLYAEVTEWSGALTQNALIDLLAEDKADPDVTARYVSLFASFSLRNVTQAEFRFAVRRYGQQKRDERYAEMLKTAFAVQTVGHVMEAPGPGGRPQRTELKGFEDSFSYLQRSIGEIDALRDDTLPERDIRAEARLVLDEYRERKREPEKFIGWKCGIPVIDRYTNGTQRGEFEVVLGYTESGKTHFAAQKALNGVTRQGLNIVIGSTEVPVSQYHRRLVIRHVRDPRFGTPHGVDAQKFKFGQLDQTEERALEDGVRDLEQNPDYGQLRVFMIPASAGMDWIVAKLTFFEAVLKPSGGLHGALIDSLNQANLQGSGKSGDLRVNIKNTLQRAKNLALEFCGRGLALCTTWHSNREAYNRAVEDGYYQLNSGAESSELENRADIFQWLLRLPQQKERHEVLYGMGKYRDGPGIEKISLYEDFGSGYLGEIQENGAPGGIAPPSLFGMFGIG